MDCIVKTHGLKYIKPSCVLNILNKLENIIENKKKKKSWENRYFVISFLFWTGVRTTELLLTKRKDVDLINKLYFVPTIKQYRKDKKQPERLFETVKNKKVIKQTIGLGHIPNKYLRFWDQYFTDRKIGLDDFIVKYTRSGIHKIVQQTFQHFDIPGAYTHMLRHSIAILLVNSGLDIARLSAFLRHKKPENSAIYYKISGKELNPALENIRRKLEAGQLTLI